MGAYIIESYLPSADSGTLPEVIDRARRAAAAMSTAAAPIRYLDAIFMPSDEVCLHVFAAPNSELAAEAAGRAGIAIGRVVQAVTANEPI
jgi:hypothetical protein